MWAVTTVYLIYTIRKTVVLIKSRLQAKKQTNYVHEIVDICENVAIFFVLFFIAMECFGIGLYISSIVMFLCNVFKRKVKTGKD